MQSFKTQKESLVELIFGKCSLVWGRDFLGRWDGVALDEVKKDWLRELDKAMDRPETIRFALENLPTKPPNVFEFRALCASAPPAPPKLEIAEKANPEEVAKVMSGLKIDTQHDPKAWAKRLRTEEQGGRRLTAAQRTMWRAALNEAPKDTQS